MLSLPSCDTRHPHADILPRVYYATMHTRPSCAGHPTPHTPYGMGADSGHVWGSDPIPPDISASQPNRQVTDRSQAAYGQAEVERYLQNHPLLMRGVPGGPSPKLGTVEFLPASQASARLNNASVGRPDDALVCWVELMGPLDASKDLSLPAFLKTSSRNISFPPAPKQIPVFDAQTGNLLLSGYSD